MITDFVAQVNTGKVNKLLDIVGELPGHPGFNQVLSAIGQRIKTRIQIGFRQSKDPWGNDWRPLSYRQGKPLINTGRLRSSITYFNPDQNSVIVGTNLDYAPVHQFGGGKVPARPFMPLDQDGNAKLPEKWEKSVLNAINQHIKRAVDHAN